MSTKETVDTSKNIQKKKIVYCVNSIVTVAIMFGFGLIPAIEPITPLGMSVLGIFLGLLYGWIFVDLLWPSILGLIALGLTGYTTIAKAFLNGFGDSTTLMIFFLLIFAAYLDMTGVSKAIAHWFISRKIVQGRPWVFTTMVFLAAYVLGGCVSLFASIVIVWSIFYRICGMLGFGKEHKYAAYVLVGVVNAASLGLSVFPFKPLATIVLNAFAEMGYTATIVQFMLYTVPVTLLAIFGYVLFGKYILKPDVGALADKESDLFAEMRHIELNTEQKIASSLLIIFLTMVFIPSILPKAWAFTKIFASLGVLGSAALIVLIVCAVEVQGKRLGKFSELISHGMSWDIVVLMAATMPIGKALEAEETGIIAAVMTGLTPILSNISPTIFIVITFIALGITTQFAHNLVLAVVFSSLLCNIGIQIGANPMVLCVGLTIVMQNAMLTPGASTQSAMFHGNEWISSKQAYYYGLITFVIGDLVAIALGIPLAEMLF